MSDAVIQVENLSKEYARCGSIARYRTLRDLVAKAVAPPVWKISGSASRRDKEERFWALKDVSFEVRRGEIIGVIGRNGAGKSTLLKILSRITEPTGGRIEIRGRVVSLLEVGTGFHPELTGRENIFLNGAILGMKRSEIIRKFDEIVSFAEVEKSIDTPVKHYSSGMYVRLAFAVAAHLDPDVLLVDEVLAVGDVAFQRKCLSTIGRIAKGGRTILLVSHNLTYVASVCHQTLLLESGYLTEKGDSAAVIQRHIVSNLAAASVDALAFDTSDRLRTSEVVVPKVEILSANGALLKTVRGGESVRVRIHYRCDRILVAPAFAVIFSTMDGIELLRLSTLPISGHYLPELKGEGFIDCVIERVPFTGGSYSIGVGVGRPNVEYAIFDRHVGSFEILPYDAYGSGFGVDRKCGLVTATHHWEMKPSERVSRG